MDLVSVIIPYYKKRNFIKETIVSVINQSYDYLEILIIYDDINLNDLEFLQEISKLDNRIKIINNNKRLGAGLSRNKGIEQSNGKYIAFIDADDTWAPDKLKDQISFMKKNNYQISHTSYFIVSEKKKYSGRIYPDVPRFIYLLDSSKFSDSNFFLPGSTPFKTL